MLQVEEFVPNGTFVRAKTVGRVAPYEKRRKNK